jgi:hypothetical protein
MSSLRRAKWGSSKQNASVLNERLPRGNGVMPASWLVLMVVMNVVPQGASVFSHVMPVDADLTADLNQRLHDILAEVEFMRYSNAEIEQQNFLLQATMPASFLEVASSSLSTADANSYMARLVKDALRLKDAVRAALAEAESAMEEARGSAMEEAIDYDDGDKPVSSVVNESGVSHELCRYRIREIRNQMTLLEMECPGLVDGSRADLEEAGANVVEKCSFRMGEVDRNLASMRESCPAGTPFRSKRVNNEKMSILQQNSTSQAEQTLSNDAHEDDRDSCDLDMSEFEHAVEELEVSCPSMTTQRFCP